MTKSVKKTRLDHFLEAYRPISEEIEQKIYDRIHRANCSRDDPFCLQIAHDTVMEDRMAKNWTVLHGLPKRMMDTTKTGLAAMQKTHAKDQELRTEAIAHQIVSKTQEELKSSMPGLELQLLKGAKLRLGLILLLLILLSGFPAYMFGRTATVNLGLRYAELAKQPDAKTWLKLRRFNDNIDQSIAGNCGRGQADRFESESGRIGCYIPLWLENSAAPTSNGVFVQAKGFATSAWAKLSIEVILILSLIPAVGIIYIVARLKT